MMIPSGSLNKRVVLLQPSGTQDASGMPVSQLAPFATVWAKVSPMSGSEIFRAQQFVGEANVQIVMRYLPGVLSNMTVQYTGPDGVRNFLVLVVLNEGEGNVQLTLLCKEINDA